MDLILCDFCQQELTSEIDPILHLDHCHPNWRTEMAVKIMLKNYKRKPRKQRPPKQNKARRVHYVLVCGKW